MQHTSDYGKNVDEMNIIFDVITAYMIFQMTRNGNHFAITINMAKILVLLNENLKKNLDGFCVQ